jgi:hypothetical protein
VTLAPWTRSPRHVFAFALTIGVNVFYICCVDWLGSFRRASSTSRAVRVFGVRWQWICRSRSC